MDVSKVFGESVNVADREIINQLHDVLAADTWSTMPDVTVAGIRNGRR
jgi:hypothetical protein